ncbi:hypothetical protein GCM10009664_69310 [Kitasatospora gansuensis]
MTQESLAAQALAAVDRLPREEAGFWEALAVHRWFDAELVAHTADALGVEVTPEQVTASPFVVEDRAPAVDPEEAPRYSLRPVLRTALTARLAAERPTVLRQAHRIAATYHHQELEPLHTGRLGRYILEINHLASYQPEFALRRLASFAHVALLAGYPEAASRPAAATLPALAPADRPLPEIIAAVAEILNAPAQVEHGTLLRLDDLLARYDAPANLAATRLVLLGRDLVTYFTERPESATALTALVAPDLTTAIDPRGVPVLGSELQLLEDLTRPARTITNRTHRVELTSSGTCRHQVTTKLDAGDRAGRRMVLADVLPAGRWEDLDHLNPSERGARPVSVLGTEDTVQVVAKGVRRLLDTHERAGDDSSRAELSRRLGHLDAQSNADDLTTLLDRARQTEEVEGFLRERIGELMRYTPVVAMVDVHPGLSSELSYGYEDECTARRTGLGGVVVSLELTLPLELRNRLQIVPPPGMVLAGEPQADGARLVPVRTEQPATAPQQFDISPGEGTARIRVDLAYRLADSEFTNVVRTAGLSMLISVIALLLLVADRNLVPILGTIMAAVIGMLNGSREGATPNEGVPLHVHAGKRLRALRTTHTAAAVMATTAPNIDSVPVSLATSGTAFLIGLVTCVMVLLSRRTSARPAALLS